MTTVHLASHDAFIEGPPHEALAVLRRTDPVHWQPRLASGETSNSSIRWHRHCRPG